MNVPQSNIIFAFLLIAFIVFVTMRGELPQYWGMMLGKCNNPAGGASSGASVSNVQAVQNGTLTPAQALTQQGSNLAGEPATSSGQASFNGWMNYFFGTNQGAQ